MKKEREINKHFGGMVKYLRTKKGMSLYDLSDKTGVSPSYINRLEKMNRKCPRYPIIEKLALALEVPATELLEVATNNNYDRKKLSTLILNDEYELDDGSMLEVGDKYKLLELINTIWQLSWEKETIIEDMYKVMQKVEEFKEGI